MSCYPMYEMVKICGWVTSTLPIKLGNVSDQSTEKKIDCPMEF